MKLKNVAVAVVALALAAGMTACGGSASSTAASSTSEAVSSSVAASSEAASSEVETESASSEAASSEVETESASSDPARLLFPKLHPARLLPPLPPESEHSHRLLEILQKASALVFRCRGFFLFSGFYLIPARHGSGQGLPQNGSLPAAGPRKVPCRSSRSARLSGCRSSR